MAKLSAGRVTLERAISKLGFASRTEARTKIIEGKVKVHGTLEKNPNRMVNPDTAHIEIEGAKAKKAGAQLILLHKTKGTLTTKRDPEGRPTIYDLLPGEYQSYHPVGRLDQHTTGLLLLTNDTKLSSFLTDPENKIPRTYVVNVKGEWTQSESERASGGVKDDGELLKASELEIIKASGKESQIKITLLEGKNREIRRLCLALGHEVILLKRISFGPFVLGDLNQGKLKVVENLGEVIKNEPLLSPKKARPV